ncbi:hypothetical protein B0H11DRAFT_2295207 [Mycena galericulata]|nr:hypothetical protein B0H11DRAFT_2295207 [Mycena galericulata]
MSTWQYSTLGPSYSYYFSLQRPAAPKDKCKSVTAPNPHLNSVQGNITTGIQRRDFSALSHTVSEHATLDINFVEGVLSSTGPLFAHAFDSLNWQWTDWPYHIHRNASSLQGYYYWLEWALFIPAAHAVAAVRDGLYLNASMVVPSSLCGESTTRSVSEARTLRSATGILHELIREGMDMEVSVCTAHNVKLSRVLNVDGVDVLEHLAHLADAEGGWEFRDAEALLDEKARGLLFQCIDELIVYQVTHIIISTQDQYVLLYLNASQQFWISRVYTIHHSATQNRDMAELVLFYTHALLTRRPPYAPPPSPSLISLSRITVPAFPPRLFRAHEAVLRNGDLLHRAKLAILHQPPDNPLLPQPLSVKLHTTRGSYRHDGDIAIFFGRLVFGPLESHVVAKAAYESYAADRLLHEFAVYNVLHALQGVAIPSLFGLYRNLNDGSAILITSYAGVELEDFDTLCFKDRRILLSHLVRLHQAGVRHNDLEPRNVTFSEWRRSGAVGPRIIDLDNAKLGHVCPGLTCGELREVARCLGLDLGAELSRPTRSISSIPFSAIGILVLILGMAIWRIR